jgi:hypothetical protein
VQCILRSGAEDIHEVPWSTLAKTVAKGDIGAPNGAETRRHFGRMAER